jgi:hypothetical protein
MSRMALAKQVPSIRRVRKSTKIAILTANVPSDRLRTRWAKRAFFKLHATYFVKTAPATCAQAKSEKRHRKQIHGLSLLFRYAGSRVEKSLRKVMY